MVLSTWWGWGNAANIALSVGLAVPLRLPADLHRRTPDGRRQPDRRAGRARQRHRLDPDHGGRRHRLPPAGPRGDGGHARHRALLVVAGRLAGRRVRRGGAGEPLADGAWQGTRGRPPVPRGARPPSLATGLVSIPAMRMPRTAAVLVPLTLVALGCAPQASSTATDTSSQSTDQTPAECAQGKTLTDGTLTVGTDSPAYDPWFRNNDPTNGKGYESAVAYAVAKQLGFDASAVTWVEGAVQLVVRPGAEELRLRHQPDLDHARTVPRWSTSPTATTTPRRA